MSNIIIYFTGVKNTRQLDIELKIEPKDDISESNSVADDDLFVVFSEKPAASTGNSYL